MSARGFTAIPNTVLRDASLPMSARMVYAVMLGYAWGPTRACTASVDRLCAETGIGRSAFFEAVKVLRERGMLDVKKAKSRNGWRNVYVPVARMPGVMIEGMEGDVREPDEGLSGSPDEGSSATRTQKKTKGEEEADPDGSAAARDAKNSPPEDFPEELRPHARLVLPILRSVAVQHGAREVTPLALGRTMMARPHKPFVKSAHDFAAWAADPPRPIRDALSSYRTWLDRERDLQGVERVPAAVNGNGTAALFEDDDPYTRGRAGDG